MSPISNIGWLYIHLHRNSRLIFFYGTLAFLILLCFWTLVSFWLQWKFTALDSGTAFMYTLICPTWIFRFSSWFWIIDIWLHNPAVLSSNWQLTSSNFLFLSPFFRTNWPSYLLVPHFICIPALFSLVPFLWTWHLSSAHASAPNWDFSDYVKSPDFNN